MVCNELVEGDIKAHFDERHAEPPPAKLTSGTWREEIEKASKDLDDIRGPMDRRARVKQLDEVLLRLYEIRVLITQDK
jgi:hypothetical protein